MLVFSYGLIQIIPRDNRVRRTMRQMTEEEPVAAPAVAEVGSGSDAHHWPRNAPKN